MRLVGLLSLAFWIALMPAEVRGQNVPSPYRFLETTHAPGIYGGYLLTDPGELEFGPRPAPLVGARYDLHLTGPISAEANLAFAPSDRRLFARAAAGGEQSLVELGETDLLLLMADAALKLHLTGARAWRGFAPFGLIGAGVAADLSGSDPREEALNSEQRFEFGPAFAAHVGLGIDFFPTESLSIRAEARDHLWRLSYPLGLTESGNRENDWVHNFAFTVGAAFHF